MLVGARGGGGPAPAQPRAAPRSRRSGPPEPCETSLPGARARTCSFLLRRPTLAARRPHVRPHVRPLTPFVTWAYRWSQAATTDPSRFSCSVCPVLDNRRQHRSEERRVGK